MYIALRYEKYENAIVHTYCIYCLEKCRKYPVSHDWQIKVINK